MAGIGCEPSKYLAFTKEEGQWSNGTRDTKYGVFSNFSKHPTVIRILGTERRLRTTEHAFQAQKAEFVGNSLGWDDVKTRSAVDAICAAGSARSAKGLAGKGKTSLVKCNDPAVWDVWGKSTSTAAMMASLRGKFADPELADILLSTGNATLVEASTFDKIWGSGYGLERSSSGVLAPGAQNRLGQCLMAVRTEIREQREAEAATSEEGPKAAEKSKIKTPAGTAGADGTRAAAGGAAACAGGK